MLKQRILTALVLAGILIPGIFLLPRDGFVALMAFILLLTAREWAALAQRTPLAQWFYAATLTIGGLAMVYTESLHLILLILGVCIWLLLSLRILLHARVPDLVHQPPFKLILGPLVLWPALVALDVLRALPSGALWVFTTMMLVWIADSAAYFAGRRFGRHKLAPLISPGKTVEGLVGALVAVLLAALAAQFLQPFASLPLLPWLLLASVVTLVSVMGDLHESQLKREAGVKDSGNLLPGHGGMFDRVDSLIAAAPLMAFGLLMIGAEGS